MLDEATAESGGAGTRSVEAAARAVIQGRTARVIAHSLSQAATADQIVVVDHDGVVQIGIHDRLIESGGRYATLWTAWAHGRTGATSTPSSDSTA